MIAQRLLSATLHVGRALAEWTRKVQAWRERERFNEDIREARGVTLLREWLSPEQQAQFDTDRYFDVIGCDSGKRYRIRYGSATNVHEIDGAMVARSLACVSCPQVIWSRVTSCLLKRLPWKRMRPAHWRWRTDFQCSCLVEGRRGRLVA
jgi:hypothetical protein